MRRAHHRPPRLIGTTLVAATALVMLAGCETMQTYMPTMSSFGVYKLDINQGNYITQDMVDRLRVGQTRQQVRLALGTPLVQSAFRDNRWDYVYEFARQGKRVEHRQFTVYFADDKLARWEGDEMPKSVADLNKAAAERTMGRMPQADDPGWLSWLVDLFKK